MQNDNERIDASLYLAPPSPKLLGMAALNLNELSWAQAALRLAWKYKNRKAITAAAEWLHECKNRIAADEALPNRVDVATATRDQT